MDYSLKANLPGQQALAPICSEGRSVPPSRLSPRQRSPLMAASSVCAFAFAGGLMGMLAGASVPTILVGLYALDGPEPPATFSPMIWGLKQGCLIGLLIGTAGAVFVVSWPYITSWRPRMTIRRWIAVVAIVAIAIGASVLVHRRLSRAEWIGTPVLTAAPLTNRPGPAH